MRTVWSISNNKKKEELKYGKHPTQKPVRLLTRMINLSSRPGDTLFTPFSGTGSECVAAKQTGRHYIGFEIEKGFCEIAESRLSHIVYDEKQLTLFNNDEGVKGNGN